MQLRDLARVFDDWRVSSDCATRWQIAMLSDLFLAAANADNPLFWAGNKSHKKRKTRDYTIKTLLTKYAD
ncbi:MAG TPA: hypothetical protein DCX51_09395 [Halomonas sp.]|nr:hypothetical protein [Halomonas sp.]